MTVKVRVRVRVPNPGALAPYTTAELQPQIPLVPRAATGRGVGSNPQSPAQQGLVRGIGGLSLVKGNWGFWFTSRRIRDWPPGIAELGLLSSWSETPILAVTSRDVVRNKCKKMSPKATARPLVLGDVKAARGAQSRTVRGAQRGQSNSLGVHSSCNCVTTLSGFALEKNLVYKRT